MPETTIEALAHPRYDRWKAPTEDGQTLLWPAPPDLLRDTSDNQRRLSAASSVHIQGVPLCEVRTRLRQFIGHTNDDRPIFATGHQAELHHPGVWVKNVLINAAADRVGGRAIHFAVDTDAPKHLQLRWPGGSVSLTDSDRPQAQWSGLVSPPTLAHLQDVAETIHRAEQGWDFHPLVDRFLDMLARFAPQSPNLPAALTQSVHALDQSLGLRHEALLVSPMCWSEPYLVFVHHILARADVFAADYNAALDEFRRENKIRTPGRPMPNLTCLPEGCEVPFWLDDLTTGSRTRAAVAREDGAMVLQLSGGGEFRFDPHADGWKAARELLNFLRQHNTRLSPRALTLTAVLRLLAADQFVHGIGGGQYDQVLDKLIARHFHFDPPRFSVTTATLFFPGAAGRSRLCEPCVVQEGHQLKHSLLGQEKTQLVEAIAAAPRLSMERAALFSEMHGKLSAAQSGETFRNWERRFVEAKEREVEEKVLFDRELFYAVQSEERLKGMVEKYWEAFA
jgi:hypothetical protein